jgi:hypothetical protein
MSSSIRIKCSLDIWWRARGASKYKPGDVVLGVERGRSVPDQIRPHALRYKVGSCTPAQRAADVRGSALLVEQPSSVPSGAA